MKIKISNIGPIHEFEIDLSKKLTMIYGKNNIGKSYAISIVYMVLKAMPNLEQKNDLAFKIHSITRRMSLNQPLHDNIRLAMSTFLNENFAGRLSDYLRTSYGDYEYIENKYQNGIGTPIIEIVTEKMTIQHLIQDRKFGLDRGSTCFAKLAEVKDTIDYSLQTLQNECVRFIGSFIDEVSVFNTDFHYLPAVKAGIFQGLGNLGAIIASINPYSTRLSDKSFDIPGMTIPVSDFYLKLSSARTIDASDAITKVIDKIEDKILNGKMVLDTKSRKIYFYPKSIELPLELYQVSSMVGELGILAIYLKYLLKLNRFEPINGLPGKRSIESIPVVFIEEPEAHVHPESQIKLLELLVSLSRAKVNIILTSHSDYMLDSLTNQILAGKIKSHDVGSILLEKKEYGSVVSDKMVPQNDGIEDHNFTRATNKLFRARIDLNEKYYERVNRGN